MTMIGHGIAAMVAAAITGLAALPGVAHGATRTVCGIRDGTAGNAYLSAPNGVPVIELARQGGDQHLLDEADRAVGAQPHGETGTQNGTRYCLHVRYNRQGVPLAVASGWRVDGTKRR